MALVNRTGSIDWCCMPRVDAGSCFGRLLDAERGGFWEIAPSGQGWDTLRSYVDGTMVLSTTFSGSGGEARVTDVMVIDSERQPGKPQLVRVVDGIRGQVPVRVQILPRFDYGEVHPWIRYHGRKVFSAIGGNNDLLIASDIELDRDQQRGLTKQFEVKAQQRVRFSLQFMHPSRIDSDDIRPPTPERLDAELEQTIGWWRNWAAQIRAEGTYGPGIKQSALALKALTIDETGAMAAAATTSLPESPGGNRNWDYRFSWIRDSSFSARSLAEIGCDAEAGRFRKFIEASAAGAAGDLQIMYGVGGERRLTEIELPLEGYVGSQPVRIGNAAFKQHQFDAYGEILDLSWRWHLRGHSPNDDYWRFLVGLVEVAAKIWKRPDRGMWESRGKPQHFVLSKAMLWVALDRGLRLAEEGMRAAPVDRWRRTRDAIRKAIERHGFDARKNTFVQAFGRPNLDASLLLLPAIGFVEWNDPRMLGTVAAIRAELDDKGLIRRYQTATTDDGLGGKEGSFLACTLWLAECLAHQGKLEDAREVFERVVSTSNDVALFSEEYDSGSREMLGNFPQALTHLSHISAAVALSRLEQPGAIGSGG